MKIKSLVVLCIVLSVGGTLVAQKTQQPPAPAVAAPEKTPQPAKLPTVAEILAKYVQAIGGRAANEKIHSRSSIGTLEIPAAGIKGTIEDITAEPDKNYSRGNLAGLGEFLEGYDGKTTWWTINPIQGNRDKAGQEFLQAKLMANFHREINLDKLYPKMELKGLLKAVDADAYAIVATPDGLPPETFYFDVKSGLLLRIDLTLVSPEGSSPASSYFDDYRDVDNVKVPFKLRTVLPQFEILTTYTEIKNNIAIDEAKFAKPK